MKKNILITGMPRSGKSTLLNKVIANFDNKVGFVTNEIRENGERVGFEFVTNTGEKSILASKKIETDFKVSRYFVNINNLSIIIPKVYNFENDDLLYIDEIGQMELFSENFKRLVQKYLDSPNICIATISKIYNDDFIEEIKKRGDIILIEITEENRNEKEKIIEQYIKKMIN